MYGMNINPVRKTSGKLLMTHHVYIVVYIELSNVINHTQSPK